MHERSVRVVPHKAITVAIEGPRRARCYGVVANISEGGACLLTDASLPLGESVVLELSFFREPKVVPATGRVVWRSGSQDSGAVRYGLKWAPASGDDRLRELIRQAAAV
jgi:Tfp pilus assembly protein PilZ